ncbi:hypothetical protein J3Q64DRAFT_1823461 [Phycomyces blakesleeanus]|uniref:Uncharacterized protein n=2 Tax=Phycomyces blakesleeanus TaxID=4837 RepID=A0A162TSU0_PHYB8|nr:hypothetical protein PHYBLDRAFT_171448 [Phycomyces blakesleeanus NRRL 1555(-)]OAD70702.1 hypothetical protein PHYBLDRAFT_171448 [Phycomyces blakesleeanus NRRL 1555(-)]|eukprot:XP_018288742.1 hypothetical protein PHYBLDRAFT_171448 [Phycomyces blakesleeanus NRRL 1555(-)]
MAFFHIPFFHKNRNGIVPHHDEHSKESSDHKDDHKEEDHSNSHSHFHWHSNLFLLASNKKFMNDPTRTSDHPDVVGYYYDPMSVGSHRHHGYEYDITNTGA